LEKEQVTIETTSTEVSGTDLQDDLDLSKPPPAEKSKDPLGEQLTYSQEYYILHREELMEKRKQKEEEAKFGDFSARLVKRPQKNFLWGYGTQVYDDTRNFFRKGELPTIREVIKFLEVYQMKEISVVNLKALGRTHSENYAIVCSGYSVRHLYNTAKILCQEVKALECPEITNIPKVLGRKDDSWVMVTVKEIQVHLILDDYRTDLDLEFRWLNKPPEEMVNKWKIYEKLGRRSANLEVNDSTFKSSRPPKF
jgi:ribosomal silencing factor RsfS